MVATLGCSSEPLLFFIIIFDNMKYKAVDIEVKDIDEKQGIVTAYFSSFGNLDSDKDIIEAGAHTKSIKERGPDGTNRIKHFKFHNSTMVPGRLIELGEDKNGGWFRSQLVKTTLGKDTLIEYEEGIITEHSHGFEIIKSEHDDEGIQHITEEKLWEVSSLTAWGANSNTPTVSVKDFKTAEEVIKALDLVNQYLKVGKFSDELLKVMEEKYVLLTEQYNSLKESRIALSTDEPSSGVLKFYQNINT